MNEEIEEDELDEMFSNLLSALTRPLQSLIHKMPVIATGTILSTRDGWNGIAKIDTLYKGSIGSTVNIESRPVFPHFHTPWLRKGSICLLFGSVLARESPVAQQAIDLHPGSGSMPLVRVDGTLYFLCFQKSLIIPPEISTILVEYDTKVEIAQIRENRLARGFGTIFQKKIECARGDRLMRFEDTTDYLVKNI